MKKIHYFSGVMITVFVGFHLFNHLFGLFGASAHIELMNNLRIVYRKVMLESILLLAVGVQIISGIKLFLKKWKTATGLFDKIQIWTGLYLAFFLLIHLGAVLSGRWILHLDTNFYFGVAGLNTFPLNLFFVPYYSLAIISFFGHLSAIHSEKMKNKIFGIDPKNQSFGILVFGVFLTMIVFYGLTDGFHGVEIPKEYKVMLRK